MNWIHSALVDTAVRELEGANQRLVARTLIVVSKALPCVSHLENAAVESSELERRRFPDAHAGASGGVSGLERLSRKQAQNIGEQ